MEDIDDDWESFLQNDDYDTINHDEETNENICKKTQTNDVKTIPKCSELYISTKTNISYLNNNCINIKDIFWKIPIIKYHTPENGVIKKQIKYSSTSPDEVSYISEQLKDTECYEEQIIEHIENPDGRIKYKDQRKISIGVCKKDILSYRSKKKRAFFNCFVVIMRLLHNNEYKEIHLKVFNTGKLEIPGIQNDELLYKVLDLLVLILNPYLNNELTYLKEKNETVLINSNFNCGYYIDRDKLHDILKYKYRINSNFDACSYPGIQCKFYYDRCELIQTGQQPNHKEYDEVSFMIFRTGSVLVVGKCHETTLNKIYLFLRNVLEVERDNIISITNEVSTVNKNRKKKIRKKIIYVDSSCVK